MPRLSESLDPFLSRQETHQDDEPIIDPAILAEDFEWTGMGCDVCGFGTVENVDEFDPRKPCPECGVVMVED